MRTVSILLAVSVLAAAPSARGEDYDQAAKDVARRYAEEGIAAHDHGSDAAAVQSFTRAYRVLGAPTIGIRLARSLASLGRLLDAKTVYQRVIATPVKRDDPPVFHQAVTDATAELAALSPRIPTLELTMAPGVTSPTLDGAPVPAEAIGKPAPIDPGAHRIGGLGAVPESPVVHEGEHVKVQLQGPIGATSPAAPGLGWRRIAGISSLGIAGVSLVVGIVGSAQASSVQNDASFTALRRVFPTSTNVCASAASSSLTFAEVAAPLCGKADSAERLQAIFYPMLAVFGGVGTYLVLTSGDPTGAHAQLTPHVGRGAAGLDVTGTF